MSCLMASSSNTSSQPTNTLPRETDVGVDTTPCSYTSFALRLIRVPASATETGQLFFVFSACS